MKKSVVFIIVLVFFEVSFSQVIFTENYSNPALWSELDDIDNQIGFNSGRLVSNTTWSLSSVAQSNARTFRPLGTLLKYSDRLKVDIDFKVSQNMSHQNGLVLFSLCQNTNQPYLTRNSDVSYDCKKNSSITVLIGDGFVSLVLKGLNSFQNNSSSCPNSYSIDIYGVNLIVGTNYYLRFIKQQSAHRIQIYTNSQRLTSSKIFDTLLCSSVSVDSLAYLMHGNYSIAGWDRTFEVSIDSTSIEKISSDNTTNCNSSSIADLDKNNTELWAYPNPTNDFININYTKALTNKSSRIIMHSIIGQIIKVYNAESILGRNSMTISTLDLPSGTYFYSLEQDGQRVATNKLQIVR